MKKKETWIEEDTLFYSDHQNIEIVNLKMLTYAYVQILGEVPYLFLFANEQHYISTAQVGFDEMYECLTSRFQFDNELFHTVCKKLQEDEKVKIWAKSMAQNYQILQDYVADADFGFEVYAEPKRMLSWDTSYQVLEASGLVEAFHSQDGSKYLRFNYPVRINQILIDQLEIYAQGLPADRPVQEYFVNIYDQTNTDSSYKELRAQWFKQHSTIDQYGYEREDQCYLRFELSKGIEVSICYTYDREYGYDNGSTSVQFYNTRAYGYLLENDAYEQQIEISAILALHKSLDINIDYLDNDNIKHVPKKVRTLLKGESGVWIDRVNKKIGFVGTDTALILDEQAIDYFTFVNILPAKGPGHAEFIVHLQTGNPLYVFSEDTYFFDQFAKELQELTNKKMDIPEAYHNC